MSPAFALMDNTSDGSKVNLDLATSVPTDTPDRVLFRSSLLGQYVGASGLGGYAAISGSALFLDDSSSNRSAIGNLEFGGLLHYALGSHLDLGVRVGMIVPTAGGDTLVHAVGTLLARPADLAAALPADTTWMRLGISPTYHRGPIFVRADFGLDLPFDGTTQEALRHINLGAGFMYRSFSATAELQSLFASNDESFHVAAVSARYRATWGSPYLAVSTPLEDELRGQIVTTTVGLTIPF